MDQIGSFAPGAFDDSTHGEISSGYKVYTSAVKITKQSTFSLTEVIVGLFKM